jgi:hypothetical protein
MKSITIHRLSLQFDAGQITHGSPEEQANQAVSLINQVLQREPFGLGAQIIATPDEIEVESDSCEACHDLGWLKCNVGNDENPQYEIQRCDACERFDNDQAAQEAAAEVSAMNPPQPPHEGKTPTRGENETQS